MKNKNHQSLIDLTRAEDFSKDEFIRCFCETDDEKKILDKLKGQGAHLLEAPRGYGKSTLLKKTEYDLDEKFHSDKILGVYINFKASLLIESATDEIGYDPFICWMTAKILEEFHIKCKKYHLTKSKVSNDRFKRVFDIDLINLSDSLDKTILDLQSLTTVKTNEEREKVVERLKKSGLKSLSNVESVANFIRQIAEDNNLNSIILLFDEAAHTFNIQQQELFFQLFKLLHGDIISVKAAVYPGITSYGGNFEIGQDAILLSLNPFQENTEDGRKKLIIHFRELLRKRLEPSDIKNIMSRGDALDLLILLSNGNPRMLLQSISKWLDSGELSKRSALNSSNNYVSNELLHYHLGLKKRLPHLSSHIGIGSDMLKTHIIPEIQKKNEKKGASPKYQSIYFTIESNTNPRILKSLALLEYSGLITSKSFVKTANRKQSKRYALHLGVAANDRVFHSNFSRNPEEAIKLLSLTDYREFYATDNMFDDIIGNNPFIDACPNGHPRTAEGEYCSICGKKFSENDVLKTLLDDSIENLSLSRFLLNILKDECNATVIRDIFQINRKSLLKLQYIGEIRSRIIINAIEEYISG